MLQVSQLSVKLTHLQHAAENGLAVENILARYKQRRDMISSYRGAYRRYCWSVNSISDLKLAPFHVLATEGAVHVDKNHIWHMDTIAKLCAEDSELLLATNHKVIDINDAASYKSGVDWWFALTGSGGEGMVVKPLDFMVSGRHGIIQPAIKCRGKEYLRIIYGPKYTLERNMAQLKDRHLGMKRSLALREFALGIEALERFVKREPLYRIHECVFGILALESEPVDPRL